MQIDAEIQAVKKVERDRRDRQHRRNRKADAPKAHKIKSGVIRERCEAGARYFFQDD